VEKHREKWGLENNLTEARLEIENIEARM